MKSCGVCALGCSALRGSDRFPVTKSFQKGKGISLPRRDLTVISALVAIRQTQASEVTVSTKTENESYRNEHHYTNYQRFRVSAKMVTSQ
jgi:hypothetical protein